MHDSCLLNAMNFIFLFIHFAILKANLDKKAGKKSLKSIVVRTDQLSNKSVISFKKKYDKEYEHVFYLKGLEPMHFNFVNTFFFIL